MTFLFDIGKVLLDFDFETSLRKLIPGETADDEVLNRLTRLLDRKDEFEGGHVTPDDYIPWALGVLEVEMDHHTFIHAWQNIFTPNEPMWRVVETLRKDGHRLILFSNTNAIHCPWIFETYDIFRHFEGGVLSFEVGAIKPEDKIYHHAIDTHGLIPADTLYIDDLPANIEAGKRLGFRTHQYELSDHEAFETWLASELDRGL
ncbi:HAD family hydrolase [Haloferula chungangensis]|uniref:HAD family hydrolase n=1 Tax=Haloferula chungangensis TaxID=1048331 RepID=A0ABW2L445_9BACT